MKHFLLIVLFLVCCIACKNSGQKEQKIGKIEIIDQNTSVEEKVDSTNGLLDIRNDTQDDSGVKIENSIGLVGLIEDISEKDTIRIYNKDKSLWHKFTFYYDDSDGKYEFHKPEFSPYAFHPDNFLLYMKVAGRSENGLIPLIVNEATMETKYIEDNSSILAFQTWEECILNLFAVGFDPEKTPILSNLEKDAETILYNEDELYHPNKIKGKWLQIKWGTENAWKYGWIQWKNKEKLLIEPYFSS